MHWKEIQMSQKSKSASSVIEHKRSHSNTARDQCLLMPSLVNYTSARITRNKLLVISHCSSGTSTSTNLRISRGRDNDFEWKAPHNKLHDDYFQYEVFLLVQQTCQTSVERYCTTIHFFEEKERWSITNRLIRKDNTIMRMRDLILNARNARFCHLVHLALRFAPNATHFEPALQ